MFNERVIRATSPKLIGQCIDLILQRLEECEHYRGKYERDRIFDWGAQVASERFEHIVGFVYIKDGKPLLGLFGGLFQQTMNYRLFGQELMVFSDPNEKSNPHALSSVIAEFERWCISHRAEYVVFGNEMLGPRMHAYGRFLRMRGYTMRGPDYRKQLDG